MDEYIFGHQIVILIMEKFKWHNCQNWKHFHIVFFIQKFTFSNVLTNLKQILEWIYLGIYSFIYYLGTMNRKVKRQYIATTQNGIAMEMLTKSVQLVFSEVFNWYI